MDRPLSKNLGSISFGLGGCQRERSIPLASAIMGGAVMISDNCRKSRLDLHEQVRKVVARVVDFGSQ